MDKAPDAFRTISEVADELDVPQHVLRFWETRFSQIRPMKRGGGRRYYRPDDLDLLRGIRHLLYGEGYTIRGVQRILREQGVKFVQSVWQAGAAQPARNPADESEDDEAAAESKSARGSRGLFGLLSSRRAAEPEEAGEADEGEAADEEEPDDAEEADEAEDSDEADEAGEADDEPTPASRREPPRLTAERPSLTAERPAASPRIEPSFTPQPAAPAPAPTPAPAPAAIALSREDLRKLQASLHELGECRRLLDQAMDETNNP